jgi:hypothetical protein
VAKSGITKGPRGDNDYGLSWIKNYGKGRTFYCAFGHHVQVFTNPPVLKHFLAGVQFVLGDLKAEAEPRDKQRHPPESQSCSQADIGLGQYGAVDAPPRPVLPSQARGEVRCFGVPASPFSHQSIATRDIIIIWDPALIRKEHKHEAAV